ncbi:MAG TPA: HAMP domain-containing sensor histidine kinase [Anaeromyxobacter sp.]|nr:HAMP domain-containing sensor histidine kinase [Anaeromyxobacter sp.]
MGTGQDGSDRWEGVLDADLLVPALLHELKQPLTGADAAVALLERLLGAKITGHEEWHLLRQQISRLAEVMNGYEELFRPGEGRATAFEVAPAVARAVQLLSHRLRPLSRRFVLSSEEAVTGLGSPAALVHAATNVLGNALDAVEAVGRESRLAVRVLATSGAAQVRVSDEGGGVSDAIRPYLFEPRFSSKQPEQGSGLGLYLSRRLMERYGGELFLVAPDDPARLSWAVTEFCITVPRPPPPGRIP